MRIGLISDTHGLLRPEVIRFLHGCDKILHAGDIDDQIYLETLQEIAPTSAVRGNVDYGYWAKQIPYTLKVSEKGVTFHLIHIVDELSLEPDPEALNCVLFGHSHKPGLEMVGEVVFLNPGSCGPRRFNLPISVADAVWDSQGVQFRILELQHDGAWRGLFSRHCPLP